VIKLSTGERPRELLRIDACEDRLDTSVDHTPRERLGRLLPDWKERLEAGAFKLLDPIRADVFQEQVAEGDVRCTLLEPLFDRSAHCALVHFVGTGPREWNDVEREPDGARLRLDDREASRVHRDPPVSRINGRQQADNLDVRILPEHVQSPGAVL